MDATSGAETAYPSRSPEFTPTFLWGLGTRVRVTRSLVLMRMFCRSLFVLLILAIVLSVLLRFTDPDYPFGIFKLFFTTFTTIK
jgi:hypothetical protein